MEHLICLLKRSFENSRNATQSGETFAEQQKSFFVLAGATDTLANVVLMCFHIHRLLQRVRSSCKRAGRCGLAKPAKKSRLRRWLGAFAQTAFDVHLLLLLKKHKQSSMLTGKLKKKSANALASRIFFRGRLFLSNGLYAQALAFFSAAAFLGSEQQSVGFYIGVSAQLAGLMREAEAAYRYSIKLCETEPMAFRNLAHVLLALGREEEAVCLLSSAVRANPELSMAHQNLAARCDSRGYHPQDFDIACYPKGMLYDAYNLVGEQLVHIGRGEEGVCCYGKAIQYQRSMVGMFNFPAKLIKILASNYNVDPQQPIRILPYEWVTQIGHIALLDTYKKLQLLGMSAPGQPILLAPKCKVSNHSYLDLWRKHFYMIAEDRLVNALFPYQRLYGDCFNGHITTEGASRCWSEIGAQAHIDWDIAGREPLIKLPDETRERGYAALKKFGMGKDDWFVALHVRAGSFHREAKHSIQSHRNADLADYLRAMEQITNRGGWVIRMGDVGMEPLPEMERVIDYPHTNIKSAWMDLFLAGTAKFCIGTTSGLTNVLISLGTPCLLVNCISNYFQLWNNRVLFIFKPLWNQKDRRYLSVSEMTDNSFRWKLFNIKQLGELGIVPHANTAEEIERATIEMLVRLESGVIMQETEADRALRSQCEVVGNRNYFGNGRLCHSFYEARKLNFGGGQ